MKDAYETRELLNELKLERAGTAEALRFQTMANATRDWLDAEKRHREELATLGQAFKWPEEHLKNLGAFRLPGFSEQLREMEALWRPAAQMTKWLEEEEKRAATTREALGTIAEDVLKSADRARDAFDWARTVEPMPRIHFPPNPILETNDRLETLEQHAAATRTAISELGKMVSQLGALGAEMQAEGKLVNKRALRSMRLSTGAAIAAALLVAFQLGLQIYDSREREVLATRIEQLRAEQAMIVEDAAKLRAENAHLRDQVQRLQRPEAKNKTPAP